MRLKQISAVIPTVILVMSLVCGNSVVTTAEGTYTPGAELLVNGDFEQGTLNWAGEDSDPVHSWYKEGVGRDGSAGLELGMIGEESGTQKQYYRETINAVPGNRYVLSFDYLAAPNNSFYILGASLGCNRDTPITLGEDADGTWQTFAKTFVVPTSYTPSDMALTIYSTAVGETPAVIDNISLHECVLDDAPESVALSHHEITLRKEETKALTLSPEPYLSNVNNAVWESSDAAVATVEHGKVTAVGVGTTTITATAPNGMKDTCTVLVVENKSTEQDLAAESLTWNGGGQIAPNTKLQFTVTVTNKGTEDVTEPFDVDILMGLERIERITYNGGIKAGETVTVTSKKWKAVAGDHMMAVHVNPTLTVPEKDSVTNNTYQINLRVAEDLLKPTGDKVIPIVEEAGMTNLTFNDDFDTLDVVDQSASGRAGYKWYVTRPFGASTLSPSDYSVEDGVMSVHMADPTYNYGLSTADISTWAGYTFNKGYMEFRIKMPYYDGDKRGSPAIWSMPMDKLHNQAKMWVEMDWMEYWGITSQYAPGHYTITMHEQWVDENNKVTDWYSNQNRSQFGFGDGEFHTLGCLWEEDRLRCYYDGEFIFEQTWGEDKAPDPENNVDSGEARSKGVFAYMNEQILPFFVGGSVDNPLYIDYIRVWQASDKTFEEQTAVLEAKDMTPIYLAIGIGCAVIIAVVVIVLIIRKRNKQLSATQQD